MKSVKERNEDAMERMRKSFQDLLKSPVEITLGDLSEFVDASLELNESVKCDSRYQLTMFLVADVDWSNPGEPSNIIPRYKTLKYGGIDIAVRDWNNRFEMGQ